VSRENDVKQSLKELFATQMLAVLATHREGEPYTSLVAFAATYDLADLIFATGRSTRKFANLTADPRVSLLIDNRSNRPADLRHAMAVTAVGEAHEAAGAEREALAGLLVEKSPGLKEFVASPTCALLKVGVKTYFAVRRFQNVTEWHLR
jgi:nitroimidazol reductase NimA-like FMN-containing flavoprotein (pyridoxamine 5'-phosphate oxidase superfamily)